MRFFKLAFLALAAAACAALFAISAAKPCFEEGESYTFFCGNTSADCRVVTVKDGAALSLLALDDVCGESTTYPTLDIEEFLESVNGEVVFCERLSDSLNLYCTADLPYSVELYGTQINLHICLKQEGVMVASPIIFGGY